MYTCNYCVYFRVTFHDATADVLGVYNADGLNVNTHLPSYLSNAPGKPAYHSVAIVIDNLSIPLLHRSAPLTCQTLADLREAKIQGKISGCYVFSNSWFN